jgi:hypothetical protein
VDKDTRYNGWTNYETWAVALWIDNEQGSYESARELAKDLYRQAEADKTFTRREVAVNDLEDALKEEYEEGNPLADDATVYADLLRAALGEVNWREIAHHYLDEVADEVDAGTDDTEEDDDDE